MTSSSDGPPLDEEPLSFDAQVSTARRSIAAGAPRSRSESAIVGEILEWFNGRDDAVARKVHQAALSGGGEPDIDACVRGRSVKIEVKRPGVPAPGPRQLNRLRRWQRAGALVGWVTDLAGVQALLDHVDDVEWINPLTGPGAPVAPPG